MKEHVRILIVEDTLDDAELAKQEIRKVFSDCQFKVVDTCEEFLRAFETFTPDVILADYSLPRFDGMKALELTLQHSPLTPFILWTGSINEDVAVSCMKSGAANYILKDNLKRLRPVMIRALEERELHVARRQAEEYLHDSEKRFRALVENGLDSVVLLNDDGTLLWESPSANEVLGYQADQHVGQNILQKLLHPEDLPRVQDLYTRLVQRPGSRDHVVARLRHADDTWRWIEAVLSNHLEESAIGAIVVSYRDITEQKKAELELQHRNDDLSLINALNEVINRGEDPDAIVELLRDGIKRNFSCEYTNIYLVNQEELSLRIHQYSMPPQVTQKIEKLIGRAIPEIKIPIQANGLFWSVLQSCHGMVSSNPKVIQDWIGEFVETAGLPSVARAAIRKLIPQIRMVLNIQSLILVPLISDGKILGILNVSGSRTLMEEDLKRIENIGSYLTTALHRKQVEDALRESQARYQNLVETSHDLIWSVDAEGKITFLNRAAKGVYGYEPEELIGRSFSDLMDPDNLHPLSFDEIKRMIGSANEFNGVESYVRHRDGRQIILSANSIVRRDPNGNLLGISGTSHDITVRKRVQEVLQEERNLLRTLIDNLPDRIYAMDRQGRKTLSNTADCQASGGKTMDDVIGKTDFEMYPPEMAQEFWRLGKAVFDSGQAVVNYEEPGLDREGNPVSILTSKIPLRDEKGNVIGLVGVGRDITERKKIENQLSDLLTFNEKILNYSPIGILTYKFTGECVFANENIANIVGTTVEQLKAQNFREIEAWKRSGLYDLVIRAVTTQTDTRADIHHLSTFGRDLWMTAHCTTFRLKEEDHVMVSVTDITERKQAEIERQALLEIMQGLTNTKDLQELLKLAHDSIARVIYAENFFVVLHDEKTGFFTEMYSVDQYDPPYPPSRLENSITSYVFRSEKPLLLTHDSFEELAAQGEMALVGTNSASWLGVPLKTTGRTIGVMAVQNYENEGCYSERDKDFLASIAAQVALVIERKRAEEALRESEAHYRTIFEGVQDAIFVESLDGKILMVNERACEMFGYTQAEFLTKTVDDMVPAGHFIVISNEREVSAEPRETINKRANGETFPIEISGCIQEINGEKVLLVVVRDITERKRSESAEREQRVLAEALRDTAESLSRTLDYGEVLDHILTAVGRVVPHEAASILLIEGDVAKVVRSHGFGTYGFASELKGVELSLETHNLQEMLRTHQPVIVYNTHSYPGWQRMQATEWLRSNVGAPISIYGEVIGFICLDAEVPEYFNPLHAERLEAFANQAALAIHNARLLQQAQEEIAERKRSEQLLKDSEERFSGAFEHASIGMALVQPNGRPLRVNWALCWLLGYSETELLRMTFQEFTHPDDLKTDLMYMQRLLSGEINSYELEKRYFHKLGHTVWTLLSVSLVRDPESSPRYFIAQIQDITDRKNAEKDLRNAREFLQGVQDSLTAHIAILDEQGKIVQVNTAWRSFGEQNGLQDPDVCVGVNYLEICDSAADACSEEAGHIASAIREILAGSQKEISVEYPCHGPAERRWFVVRITRFNDGEHNWVILAHENITARKLVEESLREEQEKTQKYLNTAGVVMMALDHAGDVILINQKGCDLLGYSAEEIIGNSWIDHFIPPASRAEERTAFEKIISGEWEPLEYYENSILTRNGEQPLLAWHNTVVRDERGNIISTLSSGEDITERKRVETELKESNTRFRTLFEASPDAIVLIDPEENWSIVDCNSAACQMNGYTREELIGQCIDIFNSTSGKPQERTAYIERIRQQGVLRYETSHRRKDGSIFTVDVSTCLITFGTRDLVLGIDRDVTERKRAEEEIRRSAEENSALLQTSLALTNLDLETTLQTIGSSANALFSADGCRVFLMEPNGETLRCVLALGENIAVFSGLEVKVGEGVTGSVAAGGKAEIVNEMHNDSRAIQVPGTQEEQEAIMFAPLKERERTIGILSVRRVGGNHPFQQDDLELLEAFASMAASAVSNARLFKETQQSLSDLRASEERFRQLADNIQEVFWMTDVETGKELYMSPAAGSVWGRSVEQLMCEPNAFRSSIFPEDQAFVFNNLEKEKRGEKLEMEYRILRPDGSIRWIWDRAFPIYNEKGNVIRIAGISADITERKEAAEKLRESEDRYQSLFRNQLYGAALYEIVTDEQGQVVDYTFLQVNPAFEQITGLTSKDVIGRRVTEILPESETRRLIPLYGRVALTREPLHQEEYSAHLRKYFEINAYATGPRQFAVSFVDVSDRKQAEQQLRKLSRAVEQSSSMIMITDTSGDIEYVNPKFVETTGYAYEEVIGQNPRLLKSGLTSTNEYETLWRTIGSGREWHGELLNKKKNGELYWASVTISSILNEAGKITHFVGINDDITQRKQSEIETRRHIAELEAVYENGLSVGRLLEPGEIGNRIIQTFARYLPWHHVTIRLRKEGSDDLELVSFNLPHLKEEERTAAEQHFVARINKVSQGLSGWVIQTGVPLRTGNVHDHPQYIGTHADIQSGLYMPLKVGDRVIGVISVESEAPDAFTEQDQRLLATLANQTAIAFENARLYEAIQKELSERKRAEEALRISETHYRALADSITDILFELDQNLRYTHWNKASETLTGIPASQAVGKSMDEILGLNEEPVRIRSIYEEVLKTHQSRTFETTLALGSEKRFFEVNAYPSMRGVSVVAKDVTERKRTETIMQKRFELMEYSAHHTLPELMQRTVDEVTELTGSTVGFFHFMEDDQIHLGLQTWSTNTLRVCEISPKDSKHLSTDQAGIWVEAVRQRRSLIQNDAETFARMKDFPDQHVPIAREMVIPIIRNERIMAVMGIGNKPQDYNSQDLEIAARLADYAWDITERKQMELALEAERNQLVERVEERTADLSRANSNLARALRVKDEFLANMSHELRTPLNAILGLSESLGEQIAGPLNEKQQKYISTISESGHHLLSLINDILDLAKIDAGQITLDINKVDIRLVCQASLRMIKQLAQKKDQEVCLDIDKNLGLMWADERRLKQMIVNLLGNAVKFTPEHGKLGVEVRADEEANQVTITVWDNGIGIKESDLERLFKPFVQLDSGLAREATGTGLGLALVSQMARLHGGSVNAVSEAGKGSRFSIILPWEPALAMDTAARMRITGKFRAIQCNDTNKPTILLVEDTQEVVMMLKDYLELSGYKVHTAQDGMDGLVQARHVKPDLILMDVQMPRMDGFETARKLRSDPSFRYTPIIALTALAMPHDRERCLEAGMDEYISKPVNLKALVKIIQSCLFDREARPQ